MRNKILSLIASTLVSTLLLTALFLLLGSVHTKAVPAIADTTTVGQDAGVGLSPGYNQEAKPGTVVTYTHVLTNTGETTDTFILEATSSQDWPVELLGGDYPTGTALLPLELSAGLTGTIAVSLTVPTTATGGTVDYTVVTATSQTDSEVWTTITDTTTVRAYVYLPLVVRNYPSPWQQAGGTGGISFYDVAVCPSNPLLQYAGTTADGLYRSTDGGETWQHWALDGWATPVVVNPLYCAEAFVTVWGDGVHRVTGYNEAIPINQGLDELYLYGLTVVTEGQTLYLHAGSSAYGVYKTDTSNINWVPVNDGISDLRIRSLCIISDTLYAGGRRCTYYHSDNGGNSWIAETILSGGQGGACGDAQVWAIAHMDNVLYASLGGDKGLYWRPEGGTWAQVSDVPEVTIYRFGLHRHLSRLYVGTYGNGVYTCESDGRCRPFPNGGLGTSNIRGLAVAEVSANSRLLAGSDDGIWWVPLIP